MGNLLPTSMRSAGAVDPLAIATTAPVSPHALGFQVISACLPLLVCNASLVVHTGASRALAGSRPHAAAGEGTAHA